VAPKIPSLTCPDFYVSGYLKGAKPQTLRASVELDVSEINSETLCKFSVNMQSPCLHSGKSRTVSTFAVTCFVLCVFIETDLFYINKIIMQYRDV
jgi:hypothetical protein